jgi:hypothetical protein
MLVSKIREDGVFLGYIEVANGTISLPAGHSFSLPPEIPPGHYAVLMGSWSIFAGEIPLWPPIEYQIKTFEEMATTNTQNRLDSFAASKGYGNITSACTYISSSVEQYRQDASDCIKARDDTWQALFNIIDEVNQGTRTVPVHYWEIEKDLPVLQWSS